MKTFDLSMESQNASNSQEKNKFSVEVFAKQIESLNLELQQQIGAIAYFIIRQRMETLGISGIKDFDPASVATMKEYFEHYEKGLGPHGEHSETAAYYTHERNQIASPRGGLGVPFKNFVHEMLHYISSTLNLPEQPSVNKRRHSKTGFDSLYTNDGTFNEEDPDKSEPKNSFQLLNEGVTEILNHDLSNSLTIEAFGDLYKKLFPKNAQKNLNTEKEAYDNFLKNYEDVKKEAESSQENKNRLTFFEKMKIQKENELTQMNTLPIANHVNPLKNQDVISYPEMVKLIDKIIDGMTNTTMLENKLHDYESTRKTIWSDLQKAYLTGNVVYLRKLESIYGEGFLRMISDLNYSDAQYTKKGEIENWKQYDTVEQIVISTNDHLKMNDGNLNPIKK